MKKVYVWAHSGADHTLSNNPAKCTLGFSHSIKHNDICLIMERLSFDVSSVRLLIQGISDVIQLLTVKDNKYDIIFYTKKHFGYEKYVKGEDVSNKDLLETLEVALKQTWGQHKISFLIDSNFDLKDKTGWYPIDKKQAHTPSTKFYNRSAMQGTSIQDEFQKELLGALALIDYGLR